MLSSLLYVALRRFLRLVLPARRDSVSAEAELLVLRRGQAPASVGLDHLSILSRGRLNRVLAEHVEHYNRARPHRGLNLCDAQRREAPVLTDRAPRIHRRDVLGGLIHEYKAVHRRTG